MSTFLTSQSLNTGNSPYVELFELEVSPDTFLYFTPYTSSKTLPISVRFRDYINPSIIREYIPLPISLEGIEFKSEGQLPQPRLIMANVLRSGPLSIQGLLGSVSFEDILGLKIIRRRTFEKYLVGNSGDVNPPVEFPRDIYYLDRIEDETSASVSFSVVSPMDLTGVTLPRRIVIGNACPWKYKGAGIDLHPSERSGGCSWPTNSTIVKEDIEYAIYLNQDDEYLVLGDPDVPTYPAYSGTAVQDNIYRTTKSGLSKVQPNKSIAVNTKFTSISSGNVVNTNHNFITGDRVIYFTTSSALTNLTINTIYYVRRISATSFSLHPSRANAISNSNRRVIGAISSGTHWVYPAAFDYWQSLNGVSSTPLDSSSEWRRVRVYSTYSSSLFIEVYTIDKYNTYTFHNSTMWKASNISREKNLHTTPAYGSLWEIGDRCGKRLESCKLRFASNLKVRLNYTGKTGSFPKGTIIRGSLSKDTASVVLDAGGYLEVTTVTGSFQAGETISGENTSGTSTGGSATVSSALNSNSSIPSSKLNDTSVLPFGAFPTARAFD
jgi:lambda family phage minor tail protein L